MSKPGNGWHRQNRNTPAARARTKEYNSKRYKDAKAAGARLVAAGLAYCWRCGQHLPPGKPWHLGHDDHNRSLIRGPECPGCNLKAAAVKGNRMSKARRTHATPWRSRAW